MINLPASVKIFKNKLKNRETDTSYFHLPHQAKRNNKLIKNLWAASWHIRLWFQQLACSDHIFHIFQYKFNKFSPTFIDNSRLKRYFMLFITTYASFLLPGTCDNSSEFGTHVLQFFWTSAFTVFSHPLAFFATDTASAEECNFGLKSSTRFNVHVPAFFQACTEKQWYGWEPPITINSNIFIILCRWFILN